MGEDNGTLDVMGLDEIEIENTSVEEIESENINLIFTAIDKSGSMSCYVKDMSDALTSFKDALSNSKESDEILVARANFDSGIDIGGYKKIDEYDTSYQAMGGTALYDVITQGKDKLVTYMDFLKNQGVRVKAVFAVFSDGDDTSSYGTHANAKASVKELNDREVTTAYISFGTGSVGVANSLGFKNILDVASSASDLRKAFDCLSKSVIESSKSVVADGNDFFTM